MQSSFLRSTENKKHLLLSKRDSKLSPAAESDTTQMKLNSLSSSFEDNRPEILEQRELVKKVDNSSQVQQAAQFKKMANSQSSEHKQLQKRSSSEMPALLKTGIENLSGIGMDDVKVHYNSSKPAQLQAHAFAKGSEIHLGPGQEKHLPHEA